MTNTNLTTVPATVLADFYKITHRMFYPEGTTKIYSTWIPRSSKLFKGDTDYAVAFGYQMFIKKYLINYFNENFFSRPLSEVISEYKYVITNTLGGSAESSHIEALHKLGYLPVEIKAVPEGTRVPIKVPMLTIENTMDEFFWLTNYLETLMSSELWLPSNSATIASHYRHLMDLYAVKTTGSIAGVEFQGHDFSLRGMAGIDSGIGSGMGHLLSFVGTDNIPAIVGVEMYYEESLDSKLVGTSIPATEHSIMSSYGRDELTAFSTIIDKVPEGIVSIVSDTYDFWNVLSTVIPTLKDKIMARDGKVSLRPDSGDPIDILCGDMVVPYNLTFSSTEKGCETHDSGFIRAWIEDHVQEKANDDCEGSGNVGEDTYSVDYLYDDKYYQAVVEVEYNRYDKQYYYTEEIEVNSITEVERTAENKGAVEMLWDVFGGEVTEQGYKVLDSHIGLLYGDAITMERAKAICDKLALKGFASTNVIFGIGSFTYVYNTRDSLGYALKATYTEVNGEGRFIEKDPSTDKNNLKKSLTGRVAVVEEDGVLKGIDHLTTLDESKIEGNLLQTVFKDGKVYNKQTFTEIQNRLHK